MNNIDILDLLGIKVSKTGKNTKWKITKSIEELGQEATDPGSALNFLFTNNCLWTCFPASHIVTEGNIEMAQNAYSGKGMKKMAALSIATSGEGIYKTPLQALFDEGNLPSPHAYNDVDYSNNCPHANNCPYLKTYGADIVGRPCPMVIEKFIVNLIYFSNIVMNHVNETMPDDEKIHTKIETLSPEHRIGIVKMTSAQTRSEYMTTMDSVKFAVSTEKGDVKTTYLPNEVNTAGRKLATEVNDILKSLGIDMVSKEKSKINLKNEVRKIQVKAEEEAKKIQNTRQTLNSWEIKDVKSVLPSSILNDLKERSKDYDGN